MEPGGAGGAVTPPKFGQGGHCPPLLFKETCTTDHLNLIEIAQSFVDVNDRRKLFLGAAAGKIQRRFF